MKTRHNLIAIEIIRDNTFCLVKWASVDCVPQVNRLNGKYWRWFLCENCERFHFLMVAFQLWPYPKWNGCQVRVIPFDDRLNRGWLCENKMSFYSIHSYLLGFFCFFFHFAVKFSSFEYSQNDDKSKHSLGREFNARASAKQKFTEW